MAVQFDVAHPVLLGPGEGEAITDRPERTVRLLFSHDLLDMTWSRYETGERGPEPHVHRQHTDAFYVLEGEIVFDVGPRPDRTAAPAGTLVAVPPNVIHSFRNDGPGRACFLNLHAPSGGFADYLRGINESFDSFDPPEDGGRPAADAVVCPPGKGERVGGMRILVERNELSVNVLTSEVGWEGVDPHAHPDHVDAFYVLEGTIEFLAGAGGPGTFFAASPDVTHGLRPTKDRAALLNVHAPDAGFVEHHRRR